MGIHNHHGGGQALCPRMRAFDSVGRIHIYDIKDMACVDDTGFVESSAATDGGEDGRMLQHPSRLLFFISIKVTSVTMTVLEVRYELQVRYDRR